MQAALVFHWSELVSDYVGFVANFLATGAVGFRYAAVRGRLASAEAVDRVVYGDAARRAAVMGLVGILVQGIMLAMRLPQLAERRHTSAGQLVTGDLQTGLQVALLVLALAGLGLAAARRTVGWPLAAAGVLVPPFLGLLSGQWARIVNPVHVLVAGLWIGTLLVLVVAGLSALLRDEPSRARRGAIAADMVNGFSPLALVCGGFVVLSGVITAWRHLHTLSALWTSAYGNALIAKLCGVALVFALGAWNWRRQRPLLGSEEAAVRIRRSSTVELAAAAVVLALTALLVSIPPPRPPGTPPAGGPMPRTAPGGAPLPTPGPSGD